MLFQTYLKFFMCARRLFRKMIVNSAFKNAIKAMAVIDSSYGSKLLCCCS